MHYIAVHYIAVYFVKCAVVDTPSVWPLDYGWYSELRLTVAPTNEQKAFQNWEMN